MEGSGTDCGGSFSPLAQCLPTRTLPRCPAIPPPHRSLHWGYLLNLSLYLGALSSLPKLATCQKSGAAAAEEAATQARERTNEPPP